MFCAVIPYGSSDVLIHDKMLVLDTDDWTVEYVYYIDAINCGHPIQATLRGNKGRYYSGFDRQVLGGGDDILFKLRNILTIGIARPSLYHKDSREPLMLSYAFKFSEYWVLRYYKFNDYRGSDTKILDWYSEVYDSHIGLLASWTKSGIVGQGDISLAVKIDIISQV